MVSIIVPVYNGEKVIERCVRSLIGQTYEHIEIIILNDKKVNKREFVFKKGYLQKILNEIKVNY